MERGDLIERRGLINFLLQKGGLIREGGLIKDLQSFDCESLADF